jgi:hypothetical protein
MFTRKSEDPPVIDSVVAVEGKFKFHPGIQEVPEIEVTMMYANSVTKASYGTCPAKMFSPKTMDALRTFLESAEEDFGMIAFLGGTSESYGAFSLGYNQAESPKGIQKSLGGK